MKKANQSSEKTELTEYQKEQIRKIRMLSRQIKSTLPTLDRYTQGGQLPESDQVPFPIKAHNISY